MGPRLYLTWWSVPMATLRSVGGPSFPISHCDMPAMSCGEAFCLRRNLKNQSRSKVACAVWAIRAGTVFFIFVPGLDGATAPGQRLVNWGLYVPVAASRLTIF